MTCENCGKYQATTNIKTIINGELAEVNICPECAKKMGYGNIFNDMGLNINQFIGSFFNNPMQETTKSISSIQRCPCCGVSFNDISHSGKVGCAKCYELFYDRLLPSIHRIHGNTCHNGRVPKLIQKLESEVSREEDELQQLKSQLNAAIENQEFENAAIFRDKINELEKEMNKDE